MKTCRGHCYDRYGPDALSFGAHLGKTGLNPTCNVSKSDFLLQYFLSLINKMAQSPQKCIHRKKGGWHLDHISNQGLVRQRDVCCVSKSSCHMLTVRICTVTCPQTRATAYSMSLWTQTAAVLITSKWFVHVRGSLVCKSWTSSGFITQWVAIALHNNAKSQNKSSSLTGIDFMSGDHFENLINLGCQGSYIISENLSMHC